jgi:hypothetical protein
MKIIELRYNGQSCVGIMMKHHAQPVVVLAGRT